MHQQEMLKGNTDTLLLALLEKEAMYGYQIVKEVDERSSGYFAFKEGTLYPTLHRLEKAKLISWIPLVSHGRLLGYGKVREHHKTTRRTSNLGFRTWMDLNS